MGTTEPISGTYQTISGQPGYGIVQNPPFHPNILNIPLRQLSTNSPGSYDYSLYRGLMSTRAIQGPGLPANQYKVNFLYNPSTIAESRSLDLNNQIYPSYARNPDDPGQHKTGLNATVSFSLLFDRTYELWDSSYVGTDAGTYGVMVDVNAFYNLLNINQVNVNSPVSLATSEFAAQNKFALIVQGTMSAIPIDLYFGYQSAGALKYFGYVTEFDITYTHFTQKMVPQRCAINVGFQVMSETFNNVS